MECGLITAAASEDVLLATFSGKVIAFSAASMDAGPESAPAAGGKEAKKAKKKKGEGDDDEKGAVKKITAKDVAKLNKELDEVRSPSRLPSRFARVSLTFCSRCCSR